MKIDAADIIAGHPARKIRDLLRRSHHLHAGLVQEVLGLPTLGQAVETLEALEREGLLARDSGSRREYWTVTRRGGRLRAATAARTLQRATADRLVRDLLRRVAAVRDDPAFSYHVGEMVVFGSYVGAAERLGDVDVAVRLLPKERDQHLQELREKAALDHAHAEGREFRSFIDALFWPQTAVRLRLKSCAIGVSPESTASPRGNGRDGPLCQGEAVRSSAGSGAQGHAGPAPASGLIRNPR